MLMLVRKIFFDYAYVSLENVLTSPPNFYDLVKILGNVGQNMTTPPPPPPPNVDGFATSLITITKTFLSKQRIKRVLDTEMNGYHCFSFTGKLSCEV